MPQATSNSNWLLDITLWPNYCFVPYSEETGEITLGISLVQEKSPGKLLGVFHSDSQEKCNEWCSQFPDWYENYSN